MKLYKALAGPIRKVNCIFYREQKASIVLEAAIVLPAIILFMLALIILIHIQLVQLALQETASQAVRTIATHIHPVEKAYQYYTAKGSKDFALNDDKLLQNRKGTEEERFLKEWQPEALEKVTGLLPEPVKSLATAAASGNWDPVLHAITAELIGKTIVAPNLYRFANDHIIEPDRISLEQIIWPDLKNHSPDLVGIQLSYEYPIKIPLLNKPVLITAAAVSRAWISDAVLAKPTSREQATNGKIKIVSLFPEPVRPGRKATVVVKTEPNARVLLTVLYKSGYSKAKNLGEAIADNDGNISWTWHVSGNTTPGLWTIQAYLADEEDSGGDIKYFEVRKSDQ